MKMLFIEKLRDKNVFNRWTFLYILFICLVFILVVRLSYLQIIKGDYYYELSEKKLMQKASLEAPRGIIYDRNGRPLADNRPAYVLQIMKTQQLRTKNQKRDFTKKIIEIVNILDKNGDKIINQFKIDINPIRFNFGITDKKLAKKVEIQWKKDRDIPLNFSAQQAFEFLRKKFYIPENLDLQTTLQVMAIEDMLFYNYYQMYQPVTIAVDISMKTIAEIEERRREFSFVNIEAKAVRVYKDAIYNAFVVGRIGKITQEQYEKLKDKGYSQDSLIGVEGIEKRCEDYLRGKDGLQLIEVDKFGRINDVKIEKQPTKGANVYLTVDSKLQKVAYESLRKVLQKIRNGDYGEKFPKANSGAAVVIDIKTGNVLALTSYPSYNPNVFIKGITASEWYKLINDPTRPMFNRAIAGVYPPGSTFKILTAIAGLQEGVIKPDEKILDTGRYLYYAKSGFTPACWIWNRYHTTHGWVNVEDALKVSCNVFFYETGRRLGIERIDKYATLFGLGGKTGIQLDGESNGILANEENKKKIFNQPWYPGDTVLAAIGQSINAFTPIQMASFIATVANGGTRYQVNLIDKIVDANGKIIYKSVPKVLSKVKMYESTKKAVFEGMKSVTSEEGGTARQAFKDLPFTVAGKTGTSQYSNSSAAHAWFVGFAPYDDPQIAFAIILENGGHGSYAAYVARDIIDAYFDLPQQQEKKLQ
ncbi:penicillin-binding protein 2 [Caldicellulosiruptor bescii]|uniref:Beta-lactamase n=2 Tax=Caldicellulosiruptor bescii TaxID=31899 RepID=B9MRV0_CALBD|nr:penicillin-binding protein 2 [Caldicellulosiruptor bescii]ACM60404.1 penicillin-binding protein 2 [Caldicellulosiruptor bescii DSM 6725]PBC87818.1 penicillin-binding protein 2 [Caldicellulosiruptor bescii]PBC90750.1 penicillin-binding protein 2 [Caldicellulosiruptor bescii]PBD03817.1 penicillin-binding protein 2 [Caldicellulosiruptor bescii]PBD06548.1 penicillin-binding protein 2 [Caldicellulosiruptor bescii]